MRSLISVILITTILFSCKKDAIKVDNPSATKAIEIVRFDQLFYHKTAEELLPLKQQFPYLFPTQVPEGLWVSKSNNADEIQLQQFAQQVFGDFKSEEKQLSALFDKVKKSFPAFKSPKVITLITDLDYESKVIYADSLLFISLDMYLGKQHEVYQDFPEYLAERYDKKMLVVDVASAIANQSFTASGRNNFLEHLINEGKKMSLVDAFLPNTPSYLKMGYTQEQYEWAEANEFLIWQYFMEYQMLYSYDIDLLHRFVFEAPFSKFYLESDAESPGRIGVYMGWQIVKAYLKNNEVSLAEMVKTDPEIIFEKSKYKPRK